MGREIVIAIFEGSSARQLAANNFIEGDVTYMASIDEEHRATIVNFIEETGLKTS